MFFVYSHVHDYPVHPGGLGAVCGWISRDDRKGRIPYEGFGAVGRIVLFVEAGCAEGDISTPTIPWPVRLGNCQRNIEAAGVAVLRAVTRNAIGVT